MLWRKLKWLVFFWDTVYNVGKLHRPRMSHGLLADNVDATLGSLLYRCTTDAVFSEVHDQ